MIREKSGNAKRVYFIDWLRVLAMITVFYYHSGHFFDSLGGWAVKNDRTSMGLTVFFGFVDFWIMPLFFFLSGSSVRFSLDMQRSPDYIRQKLKRLIIPFLVGLALIAPPHGYLDALRSGDFQGNFFQFYPHFFEIPVKFLEDPGHWFPFLWLGEKAYHLWFLFFLFIYSVIMIPLHRMLKTAAGEQFINELARFCHQKGVLLPLFLPLAIIRAALQVPFPSYRDWADFFFWFVCFFYGYLFMRDQRFGNAAVREWEKTLFVGMSSLILILFLFRNGTLDKWLATTGYTLPFLLYQILRAVMAWSWALFIFAMGKLFLDYSNPFVKYANTAVLPFYLLHETVLLLIGFFVVKIQIVIALKFLIISTLSLLIIMFLYEILIRKVKWLRFLFGLKP